MANLPEFYAHPSYFWSCFTLQEDCPFYTTNDPTLYYFGAGLAGLYVALTVMMLIDINFYWSLDKVQEKLYYYASLVRKKVQLVQKDQRRLMSTQDRTQKQLKRNQQCTRVLMAMRGALAKEDISHFSDFKGVAEQASNREPNPAQRAIWAASNCEDAHS